MSARATVVVLALTAVGCRSADRKRPLAETSKLMKDGVAIQPAFRLRGKDKRCCGYPLVGTLEQALRYCWLAR